MLGEQTAGCSATAPSGTLDMPKLSRFRVPANLADKHPDAWHTRVSELFAPHVGGHLPQFYNPTEENTPASAATPMLSWAAFPASLRISVPTATERWRIADRDRSVQDEYCEWTVIRNEARKIVRITFSTELPEYWEHLFATDRQRVVDLYRKYVDPTVQPNHLEAGGRYLRENRWNTSRPGRLMHMTQGDNTLGAALDLVARATTQRVKDGQPVTNQQELVRCAGLGNPFRNSDPQIASAVNVAAGQGSAITLTDPIGLYLGPPPSAGIRAPDDTDAAAFWTRERGDKEHTVRARFEVPASKPYVVGDLEINGRPVDFGGQVADRVTVWIKATVRPGQHTPVPRPCGA